MEFHPLDQSRVDRSRWWVVSYRSRKVRDRDLTVEAWANDDNAAPDDGWITEAAADPGSEWGQYEYVTKIGFAAYHDA
ncbi:hypothetical protein [Streptomyces rubrogriseus]|uniref:hypothetical protein n=1 Tax=Streptomyces rubrogriseus TaxID=194673 RepID=UPI003808E956